MIPDPGNREAIADGGDLFVDIGPVTDIAGVYAPDGKRIAGTGPERFIDTGGVAQGGDT